MFDPVVPSRRPGIEDELSLRRAIDIFEVQSLADLHIALGADMQASPAQRSIKRIVATLEVLPCLFARRHHVMVEPAWHAERGNPPDDVVGASGRIGQQGDSLPGLDQRSQAVDGSRDRAHPIMDHPPKIENEAVIVRRQLAQAGNQTNWHMFYY